MKWTLVDSHSLDDVLKSLANGRVVYVLEKLPDGSYGLARFSSWQPGHYMLGAFCQSEPLKVLFFPVREFIGT